MDSQNKQAKSKLEAALKEITHDTIRNFSIIAHIDHGKSTLSDRMLEITGTLKAAQHAQFLDKLQVEKERGITVKAQTASMIYRDTKSEKKTLYLLNLIDTPGHVDFSYEVSRSLHACQGAILLVDATQGVQAQTIANFYLAFQQNLTIIPVLNKIDMAHADPERVTEELTQLFDFTPEEVLHVSAKQGIGIEEVLQAIVERIPSPKTMPNASLKALLFDSWYDPYRGIVCLLAIKDDKITKGDQVTLHQSGKGYEVLELGIMYPNETPTHELRAGQVGYMICGMKSVKEAAVGDTIYHTKSPVEPFSGFKPAKPMVFAGIFPVSAEDFDTVRDAIEKLTLNDASVTVTKTTSAALGLGFRCGFLGLLHMDVFCQRLEQEYGANVIITAPNARYKIKLSRTGELIDLENPSDFPPGNEIDEVYEPIIDALIIAPAKYVGGVIELCYQKRGIENETEYLSQDRVILKYQLPLQEIATDFYDKLKSLTSGYASLDYEEAGYRPADLVKMDILINGSPVDALATIVHRSKAYQAGRTITEKLKAVIPRQLFQIVIQAAIGSRIIARESLSALRKQVTAKCYGGDITRKKKLLEKQKAGKKRMKQVGNVTLPQEAFLTILKRD